MDKSTYTGEIPKTPLKFLWFTVQPFKAAAFVCLLSALITTSISALLPLFFGLMIDDINANPDITRFGWWSLLFIGINIFFYASFRVTGFLTIGLTLKQQDFSFKSVKKYLLQHSHTYFINRFAGTLAGKLSHAGDRSGELLLMFYYGFVRLCVNIFISGILIVAINLWLGLIYVLIVLLSLWINIKLVKRRHPYVVEYAVSSSKYRGMVTDVASNIQAVRQFANIGNEYDLLNLQLKDRLTKDGTQWRMAEWNHLINNVLTTFLLIAMVLGMYYLLSIGSATIGEMVAVMLVMYRLSGIMVDIGDWMNRVVRISGEVEEGLSEILVDYEITDQPDAKSLVLTEGSVTWQAVTFAYQDNTIFKRLSVNIKPGERVGLVGPSGAGKSTFVSLLLRQHDIQYGQIMIDGQDISKVTQNSLRQNIALVPQEPMLFHRTIRENILYGKPDASEEEIILAATRAQAHEFISALPEGYDTLVGERGVKVSGGQKQRVAIARAMLKEAPILVLDEATSALDSESEVLIQKALEELMEGKTVIAVAHRLSTLREMDRILVFEDGKIIEDGSPEELTKAGGLYATLWEHQAGGFLPD